MVAPFEDPLLSTNASVKVSLDIAASDTTFDAQLDAIILEVSQAFTLIAQASFTKQTLTQFYSGSPLANGLVLRNMPAEIALTRNNMAVNENGEALDPLFDYYIDVFPTRILYRTNGALDDLQGARWATGERNIEITYETAFNIKPQDLQRACREESHRAFNMQRTARSGGGDRIGIESRDGVEGTTMAFSADDFTPATLRILERYKLLMRTPGW